MIEKDIQLWRKGIPCTIEFLEIQAVFHGFAAEEFLNSTLDKTWDSLEFKQRVMQISTNLGKYLPADYKTAIHIIDKVILNYNVCLDGFVIFFPGFVELYGQDQENRDVSMAALARYTRWIQVTLALQRDSKIFALVPEFFIS